MATISVSSFTIPPHDGPITIDQWVEHITKWARGKGWKFKSTARRPNRNEILAKLMLAVSELSEAAEAVRDDQYEMTGGKWVRQHYDATHRARRTKSRPKNKFMLSREVMSKPEGAVVEIADAIIRLMHICGELELDLAGAMTTKMKFNATRPRKHGRKA
jgi:NTP pyrophosphatase (non-canonical NTP hydrolase)